MRIFPLPGLMARTPLVPHVSDEIVRSVASDKVALWTPPPRLTALDPRALELEAIKVPLLIEVIPL